MDVAVVGAGIHGLSAARRLAEGGHRVRLFDPRPLGHGLGSSHGPSRIVRRAYPDAYHTALMAEAYPLWRELERASGVPLFHEVGLLCFGPRDGEYVAGLARALEGQGVPFERGGADRIPGLVLSPGEGAIFVPEAGWVAADLALRATYRLALAAGVEHIATEAEKLESFDRVAICPGPWVRRFWPDAPVKVTLQATAFLQTPTEGPVWIEDGPDLLYGFPGGKVGVHRPGNEVDPDVPDREPPREMLAAIRAFALRRLGVDAEPVGATGCLYTVAANEGFLFHRPDPKTLVVSACSGHGFKFGPWVGGRVAEWVGGWGLGVGGWGLGALLVVGCWRSILLRA